MSADFYILVRIRENRKNPRESATNRDPFQHLWLNREWHLSEKRVAIVGDKHRDVIACWDHSLT